MTDPEINDPDNKRTLIMSEVMVPAMANFRGNVHGGNILSLLDKVAYACAARYSGLTIVTLSVDQVFFTEPIHVGELVTCLACVNYVGKTSLEVGIKVVAENLQSGNKRHTNSCYFTMVAIDDKIGRPVALPPFTPITEKEKQRARRAQERKAWRINNFKNS